MKHAVMNDENSSSNLGQPTARITRARAKSLSSSSGLPPLYPSAKQDDKRASRANLKRAAPEKPAWDSGPGHQQKKRAALKDVTNINCDNLYTNCINAAKGQPIRQAKKGSLQRKGRAESTSVAKNSKVLKDKGENIVDEIHKVKAEGCQDFCPAVDLPNEITNTKMSAAAGPVPLEIDSVNMPLQLQSLSYRGGKSGSDMHVENLCLHYGSRIAMQDGFTPCMKLENLEDSGVINIDSRHKDPQMCSLYAADIYSSLFARQVDRKPSADYMEKLQRDVTQGMRGILIDWLVEVSEEYSLVPDTLYLTVNLIDRFLSENYIEKQKLQLLGVTCMLISSKYEEICTPRVEEFCFITDNTYKKEEVVQMESRVLNLLRFQLSVPTVKKFLRRFIQAAQASYKVPSVELEFLANYLAELTLIEYSFLKYLPSLTAASAIFLARWTLDQSDHPWNPTLEHYTRCKMPELKNAVLELQELQLNTKGGMLNAIREKYKQPKFKCVSTLQSPKSVESLF